MLKRCKRAFHASEYPGKQVVERLQIQQFKPVDKREDRLPVKHGITFYVDGIKDLQAMLASYLAALAPEPELRKLFLPLTVQT